MIKTDNYKCKKPLKTQQQNTLKTQQKTLPFPTEITAC